MVRPRLYGEGDIHNRELRRRRIKPIVGIVKHTFTESLALGNAGLSIFSPKNFPENFMEVALIMEKNQPVLAFSDYFTYICTRI